MRTPPPWLLAGLGVFAACMVWAPPGRHWLDCPEIIAAAHGLGIAHPPGHPVAILVGKAFALLVPFGSIAFRLTVASAAALAGAVALAAVIADRLLRQAFGADLPAAGWIGAVCALAAGWSGPSLLQGVRAEVYGLNALLTLGAIAPLLAVSPTPRRLGVAALTAGLGLANHHLLLFAGVAPATVVALLGRRGIRPGAMAMGGLGLAGYALLPVRAFTDPVVNWGDPRTVARFVWTASAEVFRRFRGDAAPVSLFDNLVDASFVCMDSLGPLGALTAVVGLGVLARRRPRGAVAIALATAGVVLTKAVLGFEPNNPDLRGYWLPGMLLLSVGVATVAALLASTGRRHSWAAVALVAVWASTRLGAGGPGLPPVQAEDSRRAANMTLAAVPPHGVALLADFNLAFTVWASEAVEGARPDASPVIRAFVDHPGYSEQIGRRFPALAGRIPTGCPTAGPPGRAIRTELHHDLDPDCLRSLPPTAITPTGADIVRLSEVSGDIDLSMARWLTWQHWLHALHREARGEVAAARVHLDHALRRAPGDLELLAIESRLTKRGAGPSGR